jgi:TRAP transporter TAXI family solute receptor
MRWLHGLLLGLLVLCATSPAEAQSSARQRMLTVGTGAAGGGYYAAGRAICRAIDRTLLADRMRCSVEPTPGSVYNLRTLQAGELDFAIAQADVQAAALAGQGEWADARMPELRVLFSLYEETLVLIAAPSSGIAGIEDLRGRRVNIGSAGSGTRATWQSIAAVLAWQGADSIRPVELRDGAAGLCGGELDAVFMVGFHPNPLVQRLLGACATRLVALEGATRAALLARNPHYREAVLPRAHYGTAADLETFAVASDFVTTARADDRTVAAVVRAVLDDRDDIARRVPALAGMSAETMVNGRTVAPLHPAAAAVYRERGLLR